MSYKTIVVHVDDIPNAGVCYSFAAELALVEQAHLIGLASSGVTRFLRETVAINYAAPSITPYLDTMRGRAARALEQFERVAASLPLIGSERRMVDDEPRYSLSALARYCDLCVLSQSDPVQGASLPWPGLAAEVTKSSGTPVFMVPRAQAPAWPVRRILLGWNGSREAARAMHFALPLLQRASAVDVAIFDTAALESEAGGDLRPVTAIGQTLARHGVRAELIEHDSAGDAGAALLTLAGERGAQLLVMGCYGHSRLRELLLGGATRTVLKSMTLPVFMAA
ncbi:universal stress protein [Massilia antarctica]|uniref:universal stress protein n=1 Tax=Massilia antarctica TaxID=2765360 RepID=UPI0006BB6B22|nr:universal stress protein [Massilia sp. H27-R4]MCY0914284.1 universal stress protein [Massilia sp. H27-R4]CUI08697.1 Universal stress protein UspA and related nucleotide-binding proteins [Janthinobacterium sp. CG23_2]CUU32483.1 Universal stress protein UspA and related nucleotide-binding proteins [Janthinobacterium sp. CG23_2]